MRVEPWAYQGRGSSGIQKCGRPFAAIVFQTPTPSSESFFQFLRYTTKWKKLPSSVNTESCERPWINTSNNNNSVSHATYSSITNDIEYGTSLDDMKLAAIRLALINCSCYATFCANNDGWCRQQYQNACQRMKFPALSFLPSSHFPLSLIWCN